jgi:hypothetical protein
MRTTIALDDALIARAQALSGLGIGHVDVPLLAVTRLTADARVRTGDRRLSAAATRLGLAAAVRRCHATGPGDDLPVRVPTQGGSNDPANPGQCPSHRRMPNVSRPFSDLGPEAGAETSGTHRIAPSLRPGFLAAYAAGDASAAVSKWRDPGVGLPAWRGRGV